MQHARLLLACVLAWGVGLRADSLQLAWDAPPDTTVVGYKLLSGPTAGTYDRVDDVGLVTTAPLSNLPVGVPRYIVVVSYDATGAVSAPSNEVSGVPTPDQPTPDPACTFPTGAHAILITPTLLQLTGSGRAGSKARVDFQVGSDSPVTRVQVLSGSTVLAQMDGANLTALAGVWFTIPLTGGPFPLSLSATNAYGCGRVQSTTFSVTP